MKKLFLIDGHALAYRTYFALTGAGGNADRWVTRNGEPTAGTFGFTSVMLRLIENERPDYLAVSFDLGKTFRDELFTEYKGTREKMPDDLRTQIQRINEVVEAFNIPIFTRENYEADDVLGSLSRIAAAQGVHTIILTGDRDLLQLVNDDVTIRLSGRKLSESKDWRDEDVTAKYGIRVDQFIDWKALVGDTSDNIPGVRGVGEKTALKLLTAYDTLDGIYEHLAEIKGANNRKLTEGRENAYLSQKLATIVTDLDIDFDLEACRAPQLGPDANFDRVKVADMFRELEFRTLTTKFVELFEPQQLHVPESGDQMSMFAAPSTAETAAAPADPEPTAAPTETIIVNTDAALAALVNVLNGAEIISFDTETTSVDQMQADLVGIALAVKAGEGYYIPVGHQPEMAAEGQLALQTVLEAIRPALTNPAIQKVAHNAKYDFVMLERYGITVAPLSFDTMLGEFLAEPASRNLGLKNLAWHRLSIEMTPIKELIGTGKKQITMDRVQVSAAAPYAVADVDMTLRLVEELRPELKEKGATSLLTDIEMPLVPILADMEMNGIMLDSDFLIGMSAELRTQLDSLIAEIHEAVGYVFNINSTQQLSKALYTDLEIIPPRGTKKLASGGYSTAASVLADLAEEHPVVAKIMEHRELSKLRSTYLEALPKAVNPNTGRIHTNFNQAGTVTGRIASSDPNLQNIPMRTALGRKVRRGFVAPAGYRLVALDYSQIELRVAAHMADDEFMKAAFHEGQDIHTSTAAAVFNVKDLADVDRDQRRKAKAINFGLLYGMGAFRLSRETGVTLGEAEEFVEAYFARIPGIKKYLDGTIEHAQDTGYVETLLGRRRYFPILLREASTFQDRQSRLRAEREAINAPIQGTAADIMKLAMLELGKTLPVKFPTAKMLLQVHDELVFECPEDQVADLVNFVRPVMENAFALAVPIKVDAKAGQNWEEMESI